MVVLRLEDPSLEPCLFFCFFLILIPKAEGGFAHEAWGYHSSPRNPAPQQGVTQLCNPNRCIQQALFRNDIDPVPSCSFSLWSLHCVLCVIAGWKGALQSTIGRVARTSGGLSITLTSNQNNGGFINMKQTRDRPPHFIFRMRPMAAPSNSWELFCQF